MGTLTQLSGRLARVGITLIAVALAVIIVAEPIRVGAYADIPDKASSERDIRGYVTRTSWYDPNAALCLAGQNETLVGNDNTERAFNYFVMRGLTAPQSAGILGNFIEESGVNPEIHQIGYGGSGPYPIDGIGFGIAQWTFTSRQQPLVDLAKSKGVLPNTLQIQLDYVWQELNDSHAHALVSLRQANTAEDAAFVFHRDYEVSADSRSQIQERLDAANRVLAKYGAGVSGIAGSLNNCATGSGIVVGEYSFPLAPQTKRGYSNMPCKEENYILDGPYDPVLGRKLMDNGTYTDKYGKSTPNVHTCHHDGTPAFDLSYGNVGNAPIYAITTGNITRVNPAYDSGMSGGITCNSITFKADIATDKSYYWYGHIVATKGVGRVNAGDLIGYVAPLSYGARCWAGGPHLHIDRGCVIGGGADYLVSGDPQGPGNDRCRDPGFLADLAAIWEALPGE